MIRIYKQKKFFSLSFLLYIPFLFNFCGSPLLPGRPLFRPNPVPICLSDLSSVPFYLKDGIRLLCLLINHSSHEHLPDSGCAGRLPCASVWGEASAVSDTPACPSEHAAHTNRNRSPNSRLTQSRPEC